MRTQCISAIRRPCDDFINFQIYSSTEDSIIPMSLFTICTNFPSPSMTIFSTLRSAATPVRTAAVDFIFFELIPRLFLKLVGRTTALLRHFVRTFFGCCSAPGTECNFTWKINFCLVDRLRWHMWHSHVRSGSCFDRTCALRFFEWK